MNARGYDTIVVGAGHNGLAAAAYLAKAGRKVLVLERRKIVGGSVVTEEFAPGFAADAVWTGGSLRPAIAKQLRLNDTSSAPRPPFVSALKEDMLVIDPDPGAAADAIRRFSQKDAARWPEFAAFMNRAAGFLDEAYATIMPRLPRGMSLHEGLGLAKIGLDLRLMGRRDMLRIIRTLPMTAVEFLEEWFESEELKAALASVAIHAVTLGPMSAGTGFTFLHNWLNRGGLSHINTGVTGRITQALQEAIRRAGGEIRLGAGVERILVDTYTCTGVLLASGEEIKAAAVLSAVDPKRTFLSLVGAVNLPPEFVWQVQSIKMRGSVSKVHLLTDGSHGLPDATIVVAPSIQYLERAYDAAKYGAISESPYVEITTQGKVVSLHIQFTPYALRDSTWAKERTRVEELAIRTVAEHFPRFAASITARRIITPVELEQIYGLTEGDLNHGQLMLDQFLFMRPLPGWSDHHTPIDNLYLCGSGVHAGGGLSGAAGRNAARAVLKKR